MMRMMKMSEIKSESRNKWLNAAIAVAVVAICAEKVITHYIDKQFEIQRLAIQASQTVVEK